MLPAHNIQLHSLTVVHSFIGLHLMAMDSFKVKIIACILGMWLGPAFAQSRILNESDVNSIIPPDYQHIFVPKNESDKKPIEIIFRFRADAIRKLNIQSMEMNLDFALDIFWLDNRLNTFEFPGFTYKILDDALIKRFWNPKMEFVNNGPCSAKASGLDKNLDAYLEYFPMGKRLAMKYAKSCVFECQYDLTNYPFDTQTCSVEIISKEYKKDFITFNGFVTPLTYKPETTVPPEYTLEKIKVLRNCSYETRFPCINFVFKLKRMLGNHIMTVFIPSTLVVILSWISFTLDVELGAPRVALGLTTLLTLATQFHNAQKGLPPVSYIKAIDIWMIACMISVFLCLIEFAIANYVNRKFKQRKINENVIIRNGSGMSTKKFLPEVTVDNKAKMVDRIGGAIISTFFTLSIIIFWACYG